MQNSFTALKISEGFLKTCAFGFTGIFFICTPFFAHWFFYFLTWPKLFLLVWVSLGFPWSPSSWKLLAFGFLRVHVSKITSWEVSGSWQPSRNRTREDSNRAFPCSSCRFSALPISCSETVKLKNMYPHWKWRYLVPPLSRAHFLTP